MIENIEKTANILLSKKYTDGIAIAYGNDTTNTKYFLGHISNSNHLVDEATIFDLASVTKLLSTICILKMCEEGIISLDARVREYTDIFPEIKEVKIFELLSFQKTYKTTPRIDDADTCEEAMEILQTIYIDSNAPSYSDLGFIVIEKICNEILNNDYGFAKRCESMWNELGLKNTFWSWRNTKVTTDNIQNYDHEFRIKEGKVIDRRTSLGQCHDGIVRLIHGAHAGIFSTTSDLVLLCTEILNGRVLKPASIEEMLKYNCHNDKPQYYGLGGFRKNPVRKNSEVSHFCSDGSIGISGYTGVYLCLDFINKIFLFIGSNKIFRRLTRSDESLGEEIYNTYSITSDSRNYVYQKDDLVDEVFNYVSSINGFKYMDCISAL